MKLLILSDSHGHDEKLADMISEHSDADGVIFLGDGERDFEIAVQASGIAEDKIICQVCGNCDLASREPAVLVREFGGLRFLITHGHEQNVKIGLWGLIEDARKQNCSAVLYGHTHIPSARNKEGITLINPGSAANGSCCVIEVNDGNLKVFHNS